jgi:SH3 domain-containing YSC84-like protein 1
MSLMTVTEDGFYATDDGQPPLPPPSPSKTGFGIGRRRSISPSGPTNKPRVLVKIPTQAIAGAKGLAIFTTFRTGLHISGAAGSGIVMARLADGSWSPPSGFLVHTLGAGFLVGLDIYDCVCVLRTEEAVRAFTRPRLSLGGELSVVAGPIGAGGSIEGAVGGGKPVWSYMKSRGFYAGVQADGTVVIERPDANAAFYGHKIKVVDILKGDIGHPNIVAGPAGDLDTEGHLMWPRGAHMLYDVLKAAEGQKVDESVWAEVGTGPTPGDLAGMDGLGHKEQDMKAGVHYA